MEPDVDKISRHNAQPGPIDPSKRVSLPFGGDTSAVLAGAILQLIHEARSDFVIYTRDLDPQLLNSTAAIDALRTLALRPSNSVGGQIRVLLQNTYRAVKDGHRLIELSRRLPDAFSFRCPVAEDLHYAGAFLLNDRFGYIERRFGDRFEFVGDLYGIAEQSRLKRYFDEVWERAVPASELRRLSL